MQLHVVLYTVAVSADRVKYGAFCVTVQKASMDVHGNQSVLYLQSFLVSTPKQFDQVINRYGPPMRFVTN